jgi:O-acetyl-ADP-ribose deacetylase (regulator of RNase III)
MKAILIVAATHPKIQSVSIPGLCTGVGKMSPDIAAHQMYMAFSEIELGNKQNFNDFGEAQKYHWRLNETSMIYD